MPLHIQCLCIGRTLTIRHKKPPERTNLQVLKDTFAKVTSSTKSTSKAFLEKTPLSKAFYKPCPSNTSLSWQKRKKGVRFYLKKKRSHRPQHQYPRQNLTSWQCFPPTMYYTGWEITRLLLTPKGFKSPRVIAMKCH